MKKPTPLEVLDDWWHARGVTSSMLYTFMRTLLMERASVAAEPQKPIARLQLRISDRPYTKGMTVWEIVVLDEASCRNGLNLFAQPVLSRPDAGTGDVVGSMEAKRRELFERNAAEVARTFGKYDNTTGFLYFDDESYAEMYADLMDKAGEQGPSPAPAAVPPVVEPIGYVREGTYGKLIEFTGQYRYLADIPAGTALYTTPASVGGPDLSKLLAEQKEEVKARDGDWWRGYEAALHWIGKEINQQEKPE